MTASFYVDPPTIPEGMTIAEYRRARRPRHRRPLPRLLCWLARLVGGEGQAKVA